MGAWGHGAFDNDGALDEVGGVAEFLRRRLERNLRGGRFTASALADVALLVELGRRHGPSLPLEYVRATAAKIAQRERDDGWDDPAARMRVVDALLRAWVAQAKRTNVPRLGVAGARMFGAPVGRPKPRPRARTTR